MIGMSTFLEIYKFEKKRLPVNLSVVTINHHGFQLAITIQSENSDNDESI